MQITPKTSRAARGLLDLTQSQLAKAAGVGLSTVKAFESAQKVPFANNRAAMQAALERLGIAFIPENGGGAGVRLRDRETPVPATHD
jgi:transcriptional regulator with XRE-family HTH domain